MPKKPTKNTDGHVLQQSAVPAPESAVADPTSPSPNLGPTSNPLVQPKYSKLKPTPMVVKEQLANITSAYELQRIKPSGPRFYHKLFYGFAVGIVSYVVLWPYFVFSFLKGLFLSIVHGKNELGTSLHQFKNSSGELINKMREGLLQHNLFNNLCSTNILFRTLSEETNQFKLDYGFNDPNPAVHDAGKSPYTLLIAQLETDSDALTEFLDQNRNNLSSEHQEHLVRLLGVLTALHSMPEANLIHIIGHHQQISLSAEKRDNDEYVAHIQCDAQSATHPISNTHTLTELLLLQNKIQSIKKSTQHLQQDLFNEFLVYFNEHCAHHLKFYLSQETPESVELKAFHLALTTILLDIVDCFENPEQLYATSEKTEHTLDPYKELATLVETVESMERPLDALYFDILTLFDDSKKLSESIPTEKTQQLQEDFDRLLIKLYELQKNKIYALTTSEQEVARAIQLLIRPFLKKTSSASEKVSNAEFFARDRLKQCLNVIVTLSLNTRQPEKVPAPEANADQKANSDKPKPAMSFIRRILSGHQNPLPTDASKHSDPHTAENAIPQGAADGNNAPMAKGKKAFILSRFVSYFKSTKKSTSTDGNGEKEKKKKSVGP